MINRFLYWSLLLIFGAVLMLLGYIFGGPFGKGNLFVLFFCLLPALVFSIFLIKLAFDVFSKDHDIYLSFISFEMAFKFIHQCLINDIDYQPFFTLRLYPYNNYIIFIVKCGYGISKDDFISNFVDNSGIIDYLNDKFNHDYSFSRYHSSRGDYFMLLGRKK